MADTANDNETPDPLSDGRLCGTIVEAGKVLGIGKSAAYEGARQGQIPTIKVGRRRVVPWARFLRMIEGEGA
jgi:excisionase family DNA binding protein